LNGERLATLVSGIKRAAPGRLCRSHDTAATGIAT